MNTDKVSGLLNFIILALQKKMSKFMNFKNAQILTEKFSKN